MPRVIHFEIAVDDTDRASKFYTTVFGWKINKWEGPIEYWLVSTDDGNEHGINGAIMKREDSSTATINTIDVSKVLDFMDSVKKNGGTVLTEKMTVPGVGYFAYCKDTEGNTFGIMEEDESAK
ncbi:MAG: VOC family protein [Candidatus Neomarinimicrobiota bacterium]